MRLKSDLKGGNGPMIDVDKLIRFKLRSSGWTADIRNRSGLVVIHNTHRSSVSWVYSLIVTIPFY